MCGPLPDARLRGGLEEAWDKVVKSKNNPLRHAMGQSWRADGAAPLPMLNGTVVETGKQVPVSRVELTSENDLNTLAQRSLRATLGLPERVDVPLSTAMSLSARFPVVMPAGSFQRGDRTYRLVGEIPARNFRCQAQR